MPDKIITISEGQVRGAEHTTKEGKSYYGFHGIPYAEPPIGPLRFKDPVPAQEWKDIKDVTDDTKVGFVQYNFMADVNFGTETLTLNVYTPKLLEEETLSLPVMVFFHGGGFELGLAGKDIFGPDYLIEKDVVVVAVHYRLGVFGFLCLDLPEAPGNAGLKDQVLALKWIQKNIHAFNGDSSNVTIFGTSAGSASVEYHIVSPMSKNLFHKAIGQSGSCINPWALNINPKESAIGLAKLLGKNISDSRELLKFFMSLPTEELVLGASLKFKKSILNFTFVPTIEKTYPNVSCFLSENPIDILKSQRQHNVPLLTGFCEKEGLGYCELVPFPYKIFKQVRLASLFLLFGVTDENLKTEVNEYYSQYKSMEDKFEIFFGDMSLSAGIMISAKFQSMINPNSFVYKFSFDGGLNTGKFWLKITKPGAAHSDQEGYICFNKMTHPEGGSPADVLVRERLVQMWTNFAKTGNPTPNPTDEVKEIWPPVKDGRMYGLIIDKDLTLGEISQEEWLSLWERVYEYPKISPDQLKSNFLSIRNIMQIIKERIRGLI